eukprot:3934938-Rhodomonas_salina.3
MMICSTSSPLQDRTPITPPSSNSWRRLWEDFDAFNGSAHDKREEKQEQNPAIPDPSLEAYGGDASFHLAESSYWVFDAGKFACRGTATCSDKVQAQPRPACKKPTRSAADWAEWPEALGAEAGGTAGGVGAQQSGRAARHLQHAACHAAADADARARREPAPQAAALRHRRLDRAGGLLGARGAELPWLDSEASAAASLERTRSGAR